jgi:hypothetical protein
MIKRMPANGVTTSVISKYFIGLYRETSRLVEESVSYGHLVH